jgi:hypothetical protein
MLYAIIGAYVLMVFLIATKGDGAVSYHDVYDIRGRTRAVLADQSAERNFVVKTKIVNYQYVFSHYVPAFDMEGKE